MFGSETIRLLREKWKSPWALAQELYAVFQDDVPITHSGPLTLTQKDGSTEAPLTIKTWGDDVPALNFVNRHTGEQIGGFTLDGGVMHLNGSARKSILCRCPDTGPLTPAIVWPGSANEILGGRILDADILNAVAYDPRTLDNPFPTVVPGVFVYTPAAGALLTGNTNPTLNVVFTPTDVIHFTTASSFLDIRVDTIFEQSLGSSPPVLVGQMIVVYVTVSNGEIDGEPAATTVAVTDSLGNTYQQAGSYQSTWRFTTADTHSPRPASKNTISIWYAMVTTPGTAAISVEPTPSLVGVDFRPTVVSRVNVSGPLDGVASNTAVIDTVPQTVETTLISSSAGDGELDLFVAMTAGAGNLTSRINHDAQNITGVTFSGPTDPPTSYVALGVSFRQKPTP